MAGEGNRPASLARLIEGVIRLLGLIRPNRSHPSQPQPDGDGKESKTLEGGGHCPVSQLGLQSWS
ncbi:hypothetical protein KI387_042383, partial [Taxus chinensis]